MTMTSEPCLSPSLLALPFPRPLSGPSLALHTLCCSMVETQDTRKARRVHETASRNCLFAVSHEMGIETVGPSS